jgi:hypothetical protein
MVVPFPGAKLTLGDISVSGRAGSNKLLKHHSQEAWA